MGPRRKPTTNVLLKEHCNKVTANDGLLYPQISALVSSHWRSFFLQQMEVNTETHKWAVYRGWDTVQHSVVNGIPSSRPYTQGQSAVLKRRQKGCKSQSWGITPRKQCHQFCVSFCLQICKRVKSRNHRKELTLGGLEISSANTIDPKCSI